MKKTAIITGADGGMGREISRAVALAGYRVIIICKNRERGEKFRDELIYVTRNTDIEMVPTDLSSLSSIRDCARYLLDRLSSADLLMNNAGTLETHYSVTSDGFERTVAVNYIAPYVLTNMLLPLMHRGSRIVNMVSCTYRTGSIGPHFFTQGREGDFWRIPVYSNTKLALWLFTLGMAHRLKDRGITVNAADPGIVSTRMIKMDMWFDPLTDIFFRPLIRKPRKGADMAIRLLLEPVYEGCTGGMYVSGRKKNIRGRFADVMQAQHMLDTTADVLKDKISLS